jgi:hypothetical protein
MSSKGAKYIATTLVQKNVALSGMPLRPWLHAKLGITFENTLTRMQRMKYESISNAELTVVVSPPGSIAVAFSHTYCAWNAPPAVFFGGL